MDQHDWFYIFMLWAPVLGLVAATVLLVMVLANIGPIP